jgi:predicted RNA binding protein YcfA (HicA-like mRNA interferase family)
MPRDLSGEELIKKLIKFNYKITRQTGSHLRLTRTVEGIEHHITIPNHNPLRVGTLNNIIQDLASHLGINKSELLQQLF